MIRIDDEISPQDLTGHVDNLFAVAAKSVRLIKEKWNAQSGTPVFTWDGEYTSRGWTEWTQGFQYGCALLTFEATGDQELLDYGREETVARMAPHVSHIGVHDHGFNNVSTYGTLLRQMTEGTIPEDSWQREFYQLALKLSGAIQASRWTDLPDDLGYVCSFNGAHSLFSDTIRSMRALCVAHQLGHVLMGEQDSRISLLGRALTHAETTARFNVYFGSGRDSYDIRGRVVHESIFNLASGSYRCPSTQQGYSPFTTWTRGLSWILAGYPEQLEFLDTLTDSDITESGYAAHTTVAQIRDRFLEVARAVADFYLEYTPTDGVPYWDTGAPGLARMGDYLLKPADPYNDHEPVDSSAAAIAAQGLIRLGQYLVGRGDETGSTYLQAGLTTARTIMAEPYLATDPTHQGIILHSIYHRPNGWDYIAPGQHVPNGESSMWGDYHALELGLMIKRMAEDRQPQRFFDIGSTI